MKLSKQLLYDRMSEYYTIHVYGAMDAQTELDKSVERINAKLERYL